MSRVQRAAPPVSADAIAQLAQLLRRNGFVRWQNRRRAEAEGWDRYKKGDEVRLVANTPDELVLIRRLLREAGFQPGRPYVQGRQHRQPIYGRAAVRRFLDLVGGPSPRNRRKKAD
jgi:hypothetical protein